jgi:hypothetical protein
MTDYDNYNISDDSNLEKEFYKLGFDYQSMRDTIRYLTEWSFSLTSQGILKYSQTRADDIYILFTVIQLDKQHYSIYNIHATLLISLPDYKKTRIFLTKEYSWQNSPLPTKQNIANDFTKIRLNPWVYVNRLSMISETDFNEQELN